MKICKGARTNSQMRRVFCGVHAGIELHNSRCTGHVRAGCDITLIMRTSQTCEDFVQFWCCCVFLGEISDSDSLFYYEAGEDHDSLSDPDYVPAFSPVINPDVDQALVLAVCGSDLFCIFRLPDYGFGNLCPVFRPDVSAIRSSAGKHSHW